MDTFNRYFIQIIEKAAYPLIIHDERDRILFFNPAFSALTGLAAVQENNLSIDDFLDPSYRIVYEKNKAGADCNSPRTFSCTIKTAEGEKIPAEFSVQLFDDSDTPLYYSIIKDCSESFQSRSESIEKDLIYRNLFHNSINAVAHHKIITDQSGEPVDYQFLEVNEAFEAFTGLKASEIKGRCVTELIPGIKSSGLIEAYGRVALTGLPLLTDFYSDYFKKHYEIKAFSSKKGYFTAVFTDITERKVFEKTIRENQSQYWTLMENMNQGVVYQNEEGEIQTSNPAAKQLLGPRLAAVFSFDSNPSRPLCIHDSGSEFLPDEYPAFKALKLRKKIDNVHIGVFIKEKDDYRWFNVTAIPYFRKDALHPDGVYTIFDDITERRKYLQDLKKARDEAETATRVKSDFLANMSHELRTPLHAIMGMAALLEETELIQEQKNLLDMIKKSSENLYSIIKDILDFNRIDSGKMKIEISEFSLREMAEAVIKSFKTKYDASNVEIRLELDDDCEMCRTDRAKLYQILINLVSNAVKYTEKGTITVRIYRDEQLVIEVQDPGSGIPAAELEYIFDAFRQAEATYTKKHQGLGLGLAIVKQLCELLGGRISAESTEGIGSSFTLTLPVQYCTGSEAAVKKAAGNNASDLIRGKKILIVEGELINRMYLLTLLKKRGAQPAESGDGQDALQKIENQDYDLVMMDIGLPVLNGLDAVKLLRKKETGTGKHQKVIALTAHTYPEDIKRFLEAGMDSIITKPVTEKELLNKIEEIFS